MKRKLLLSTLLLIFTHFGFTQVPDLIVSGYVFDYSTGTTVPVEDQAVDIMIDSTNSGFSYENTVLTDSMGYFADTIELNPPFVVGLVHISTFDSCLGHNQEIITLFNPGAPPFPVEFLLCDNFTPGCEAFFYYYPLDSNAFSSLSYQFMDASFGDPDTWLWDFGDGDSSFLKNPSHTYADTGYYEVCLTITDSLDNCTDTYCEIIYVDEIVPPTGCISGFTYYPDTSALTINFEGYTQSLFPTTWSWEFGDGTTGSGQFVSQTYDSAGVYPVTLITVDSTGCSWVTTMDVWVGNPTFDISGTVFLDSNLTADEGIVRLMTADSLWQDVIVLDSTDILPDGSFIFEDVPMYFFMLYYVQAELTDSSAYFGDYLPTYHISSLTWQSAFPVLPVFGWPADVYMIPSNSMNSGPGSITGSVTSLDTRGKMSGVHVMLMDEEMNPYTYVVTDEDGIFEFDNIAYGTYAVHAELMGIHTTQAVITLSEETPESQVNFIVEGNTATLSISEDHGLISSSGNVYPNPVTDRAWLEIDSEEPVELDVMIFNQMGQKVYHERLKIGEGNQRILLNTSSLSPGIHFLNIITENGDNISKKLVKTR